MGLLSIRQAPERARAIALALVLVLQSLVPAAALAGDASPRAGIQICTSAGLQHLPGDPRHRPRGFAGLACEQCVMASLAMVAAAPPPLAMSSNTIAFVFVPVAERPSALPRAPPRPPSQGPPVSA